MREGARTRSRPPVSGRRRPQRRGGWSAGHQHALHWHARGFATSSRVTHRLVLTQENDGHSDPGDVNAMDPLRPGSPPCSERPNSSRHKVTADVSRRPSIAATPMSTRATTHAMTVVAIAVNHAATPI